MTQEQLISKLQKLNQIKPRKDWVALTKNQILGTDTFNSNMVVRANHATFFSGIFQASLQRKIAYTLATLLFVIAGVAGVMKYDVFGNGLNTKTSQQSATALVEIKNNVEVFKEKSKNLAEISKDKSQNVTLAIKEVREAAKELTDAIDKDPYLARSVALDINNNKTYLEISGGDDLKEASNNLCRAVVGAMIKDGEKNSLIIEKYQKSLDNIKSLYEDQNNCPSALENFLLLNIAIEQDSEGVDNK